MYARYALQCTLLRKAFQSKVQRIPVIRMLRMFPFWKQQMAPGGPRKFLYQGQTKDNKVT